MRNVLPERLYRGVNPDLHADLDGELRPKAPGRPFMSEVHCGDPHALCGTGVVAGRSSINEAVLHQWRQLGLPTCGVSTTPIFERARIYALHGGRYSEGYVYEIDSYELNRLGVAVYRVNDIAKVPAIPEDDEHILVAADFGVVPRDVVTRIFRVTSVAAPMNATQGA